MATEHTLSYRAPGAVAGEYTTEDMAAGDTIFGDHETLIARVPKLMEFLISFFFKSAIERMKGEIAQKKKSVLPLVFF